MEFTRVSEPECGVTRKRHGRPEPRAGRGRSSSRSGRPIVSARPGGPPSSYVELGHDRVVRSVVAGSVLPERLVHPHRHGLADSDTVAEPQGPLALG